MNEQHYLPGGVGDVLTLLLVVVVVLDDANHAATRQTIDQSTLRTIYPRGGVGGAGKLLAAAE